MSSVLRKVGRSKQKRLDRGAQIVSRERYESMELDSKVQLIQDLTSMAMMHISEVLQQEVAALAAPGTRTTGTDRRRTVTGATRDGPFGGTESPAPGSSSAR